MKSVLATSLLTAVLATALLAAPPSITELQPRGTQKGRSFTLTIAGQNLGEGPTVISTLPASFTPLAPEKPGMEAKYATFLVEPTGEWTVGVYPMRIQATNGISNILLFSVGAFPEITEEESRPGALPNQNDSIEKAQPLPATPITLNGTLRGAERDVYRLQAKAGERRVIEIDARRVGSAIDPVIRVIDGSGKLIARSEDSALLQLDARLDLTFAKEGLYYVEVHDARYSMQEQNFYRLKTGAYEYASEVFPLGGRRGEAVDVAISGKKVRVDLAKVSTPRVFVNLADSPALPLPFAVGDEAEVQEPVSGQLQLPVTINARLSKPGEVDRYELDVAPGEEVLFELEARELGTSRISGLLTIYDTKGKRLDSAGDEPLPVDVAAVQVSSRTQGDPHLLFKAPDGVRKLVVTVEDLALRGGPQYGYRLHARKTSSELRATIVTPFVNIPAGGTALVAVDVQRRGFHGPLKVEVINPPEGVTVAGGDVPQEVPDPNNRATSRRAILTLTAAADAKVSTRELALRVVGKESDGKTVMQQTRGLGYAIGVAGATAQGVVDRQRSLTGAWLGYQLPVALTDPPAATLELALVETRKKEAGFEFKYRWTWHTADSMQGTPPTVGVDVPNFIDLRVIEMEVDSKDRKTGTFLVTSTRNTLPAVYNIGASGRLRVGGSDQLIYSPMLKLTVPAMDPEERNATAAAQR